MTNPINPERAMHDKLEKLFVEWINTALRLDSYADEIKESDARSKKYGMNITMAEQAARTFRSCASQLPLQPRYLTLDELGDTDKYESLGWQPISTAPKGATEENPCREHWILGTNGRQCRVIRWCMEYPHTDGVWMFAYEPGEYIDGVQQFYPTHWMPLPDHPKS